MEPLAHGERESRFIPFDNAVAAEALQIGHRSAFKTGPRLGQGSGWGCGMGMHALAAAEDASVWDEHLTCTTGEGKIRWASDKAVDDLYIDAF